MFRVFVGPIGDEEELDSSGVMSNTTVDNARSKIFAKQTRYTNIDDLVLCVRDGNKLRKLEVQFCRLRVATVDCAGDNDGHVILYLVEYNVFRAPPPKRVALWEGQLVESSESEDEKEVATDHVHVEVNDVDTLDNVENQEGQFELKDEEALNQDKQEEQVKDYETLNQDEQKEEEDLSCNSYRLNFVAGGLYEWQSFDAADAAPPQPERSAAPPPRPERSTAPPPRPKRATAPPPRPERSTAPPPRPERTAAPAIDEGEYNEDEYYNEDECYDDEGEYYDDEGEYYEAEKKEKKWYEGSSDDDDGDDENEDVDFTLDEEDMEALEDYDVHERIGAGAFSVVRRVSHKVSGEIFALKIISREITVMCDKLQLQREIAIMQTVKHPSIIRYHGHFTTSTKMLLLLELMHGGEMLYQLSKDDALTRHYSEDDARRLMRQILGAVAHLHSIGVAHRDLKPENILFARPDSIDVCKLADFGLAKHFGAAEQLSEVCGTPEFQAPEIHSSGSSGGYDGPMVDVFAIGVIGYILLCGYAPWSDSSLMRLQLKIRNGEYEFDSPSWDCISAEAKDLAALMLSGEPSKRPTAAAALRHPWLAADDAAVDAGHAELPNFSKQLHRFHALGRFRYAVMFVLAANRLGLPVKSVLAENIDKHGGAPRSRSTMALNRGASRIALARRAASRSASSVAASSSPSASAGITVPELQRTMSPLVVPRALAVHKMTHRPGTDRHEDVVEKDNASDTIASDAIASEAASLRVDLDSIAEQVDLVRQVASIRADLGAIAAQSDLVRQVVSIRADFDAIAAQASQL
jgi:serine/threonine protein kinase